MFNTYNWVKEIVIAINSLNGEGTLEEIYEQVKKNKNIKIENYTDWKAQIRKNIYLHSSDCDIFKGRPGDKKDIFYSIDGKGTGKWGLRKTTIDSTVILPFSLNKYYKRSEIHDSYGGNRQRGISPSRKYPVILIFSGKRGNEYGYKDGWQNDSIFLYTGEGQTGPQEFKEGNLALKDHIKNGKDVYLFEKNENNGMYQYKGQLELLGFHYKDAPDKNGVTRKVIVFEFELIDSIIYDADENDEILKLNNLIELRNLAIQSESKEEVSDIKERKQIIRKRAAAIKKYALVRAKGKCEACEQIAPFNNAEGQPFLEVHHLLRLSDGGADHPDNVAAICPNCHRRAHYSNDAFTFNNSIIDKIKIKEDSILDI
ncbi:HNH endonuclease [Gottfriedia acidiceleris]|uniref:HNH endonuclease n=1 Tax=Gottfriedia acidiceleris TaxID=371036 RepID=UPI000B4462DF|nr:HNH endonuclease [Gottfriedia acidiceleris]